MRPVMLAVGILALAACGSAPSRVEVPSNHGHLLGDALQRLHAAGLRATFPAAATACGDGLPWVGTQSPRAPARVRRGSVVVIHFGPTLIPSPGVPLHHARFTTVPKLVGHEFAEAAKALQAIWPCVHVQAATATSSTRLVVVAQDPSPGSRVPAYGVRIRGGGFRPTTVQLTVAAR